MSKTCTAPGHPTCTITCPKGCIAWYDERNKRCVTSCTNRLEQADLDADSRIAISVSDLTPSDLLQVFGKHLSADFKSRFEKSSKTVSFALDSATIGEIEKAVRALL